MTTTDATRTTYPLPSGIRRNHALPWAFLIVGLLSLQVGLCMWGVYCAVGNGGAAVESDYYNKALHWDNHLAMQEASKRLGWQTVLTIGATTTSNGSRALILDMRDNTKNVVPNADVEVTYFHHAHPLDLQIATLRATADGTYVASVPLSHHGIWEFRITAKRGAATFIETIVRDVEE